MDVLLLLKAPGRLLTGDNLRGDVLKAKGLYYGDMPWWVMSDVLFTNKREFVGVVLYAEAADAAVAQKFASACDPKIARYLPNSEAAKLPRYQPVLGNSSVLELRWSETEPDQEQVTQLGDYWYYQSSHPVQGEYPCAWGYPQIDKILASKRLTLPEPHY
jgi:hypothetical protein